MRRLGDVVLDSSARACVDPVAATFSGAVDLLASPAGRVLVALVTIRGEVVSPSVGCAFYPGSGRNRHALRTFP